MRCPKYRFDNPVTFLSLGSKDVLSINKIHEAPIFDPIWAIGRGYRATSSTI